MTVKLLAAYGPYPINAIVTLDTGTEAGLVAAKLADTTTTGGVAYTAPVPPNSRFNAQVEVNPNNGTVGLAGPDGLVRKLGQPRAGSALICGDSTSAFGEANITLASSASIVDNGDGTATATFPSAHNAHVGAPLRVNVAQVQALNVMDSKVTTIVSPTVLKFQLGGRTHKVVAANAGVAPVIIWPLRRGSRGWFNWTESYLGISFQTTWCAVGGATTAQISALLDATPMTDVADFGFMCTGMNDIYAYGNTQAQVLKDLKTLADKVIARSHVAVLMAIPPRSSADTANWSTAKLAVYAAANRFLQMYALLRGAIFFDPAAAVQNGATYVDPTATYPDPTPAFLQSAPDYTHPSARGAMAWGFGVGTQLTPFMGVRAWKPAHRWFISPDTGNKLPNADMSANTGGLMNLFTQSSVTAGLSITPTVAKRVRATDGDDVGYKQVFTTNYGTVASGLGLFTWQRSGIQSLVTPGTTVQWKVMCNVLNSIGLQGIEIQITGILADGSVWTVYGLGLDGNTKALPGTFSYALMTPPAVVPAGLTNLTVAVRGIMDSTQTTDLGTEYYFPELIAQI